MMAPAIAARSTAGRLTVCWKASTPPNSTAISPGKMNPTNAEDSSAGSTNTTANAAQPGSPRIRSATDAITTSSDCSDLCPWPASSEGEVSERERAEREAVERERGEGTAFEIPLQDPHRHIGRGERGHTAGQCLAA